MRGLVREPSHATDVVQPRRSWSPVGLMRPTPTRAFGTKCGTSRPPRGAERDVSDGDRSSDQRRQWYGVVVGDLHEPGSLENRTRVLGGVAVHERRGWPRETDWRPTPARLNNISRMRRLSNESSHPRFCSFRSPRRRARGARAACAAQRRRPSDAPRAPLPPPVRCPAAHSRAVGDRSDRGLTCRRRDRAQ